MTTNAYFYTRIFRIFRIDLPDFQRFIDASRSKPICVAYIENQMDTLYFYFTDGMVGKT